MYDDIILYYKKKSIIAITMFIHLITMIIVIIIVLIIFVILLYYYIHYFIFIFACVHLYGHIHVYSGCKRSILHSRIRVVILLLSFPFQLPFTEAFGIAGMLHRRP